MMDINPKLNKVEIEGSSHEGAKSHSIDTTTIQEPTVPIAVTKNYETMMDQMYTWRKLTLSV